MSEEEEKRADLVGHGEVGEGLDDARLGRDRAEVGRGGVGGVEADMDEGSAGGAGGGARGGGEGAGEGEEERLRPRFSGRRECDEERSLLLAPLLLV